MKSRGLLISEVAELFHITVDTLRYYDREGILVPSCRSGSNYRYYNYNDISRLTAILLLRKMDVSLKDIRRFIDYYDIDDTLNLLESRKEHLDRQITELTQIRDTLTSQMDYIRGYRDDAGSIRLKESRAVRSVFYVKRNLHSGEALDEIALVREYLASADEYSIPEEWFLNGHLGVVFNPGDPSLYDLACFCYADYPGADEKIPPGRYVSYIYKGIEHRTLSERKDQLLEWIGGKGLRGRGRIYQIWQIDDFHSHREQDWVNEMQIFLDSP